MKHSDPSKVVVGLACCLAGVAAASAASSISVDMDLVAPGIQSVRPATIGDLFSVGLVMTVDANGVSSYGISARFDNTELSLTGPAVELQPIAGGFNFTPGVFSQSTALGQVYTFEAATFGAGPVSTSFLIGTIPYQVVGVVNDGFGDVTPGLFNVGIDGFFDNFGAPGILTFNAGFVVPEPGTAALLLCGTVVPWLVGRRLGRNGR